ncbi:MAG: NYN domain-containing protein [Candidatus Poribacteria bacterium]|nr:NYN domain-containing protein [Candidatus Poribacteria bacterium]
MSWIMLVDGYNVLLNWPQFTHDIKGPFDVARNRLIRTIANFAVYHGHRVIVVFDAQKQNLRRVTRKKQDGIEVVYTKREQTADAYIVEWIRQYSGDEHIEVITSDVALGHAVRRLGASVGTTFEFSDTFARTGGNQKFSRPQNAIPDSDPRLADRIDRTTRRQLEQLKRKLKHR